MTRLLVIVVIDVVVWGVWSTLAGYIGHRVPARWLDHDSWVFRLRGSERDGSFYVRHTAIKKWKRFLPEAGDVFNDGFHKRHLRSRDRNYMERFVIETRRAEFTHYLVMAVAPFFFLWNPWWLGLVMVAYAVLANVPCVAAQRYNRARFLRVLAQLPPSSANPTRIGDTE
ncbi:MAG: glycosyl-4,4'-diaponeurosporenoate acyltransferase [Acidimicrobiia bacterium]